MRSDQLTKEQLAEYKELAKQAISKLKIEPIPKSNTESLGDRITNYASAVN